MAFAPESNTPFHQIERVAKDLASERGIPWISATQDVREHYLRLVDFVCERVGLLEAAEK